MASFTSGLNSSTIQPPGLPDSALILTLSTRFGRYIEPCIRVHLQDPTVCRIVCHIDGAGVALRASKGSPGSASRSSPTHSPHELLATRHLRA